MNPSILSVEGLRKHFSGVEVLRGIDLEVRVGETVAVLGASGSGKSTLLRCINYLENPDAGSVRLDGEIMGHRLEANGTLRRLPESRIAVQRRHVGMVFQNFNLFPHWTVMQNIADGPRSVLKMSRTDAEERGMELLRRVGLGDRASSYPRQLSGGQQQRVAIARALALEPSLLLFDEPTSALDPANVGEVTDVMRALSDEGATMLVVTHEIGFARAAADRVIFMDHGRVVEHGTPTRVLDDPQETSTREFLRKTLV